MRDSASDQRRAALAAAWVGTLFPVLTGCHLAFPYDTEQGSDGGVDALVDTLRVADSEPFRDLVRRKDEGVEGPHGDQFAPRVDQVTGPLDTVPLDQVTPPDCDQPGTWSSCTQGPGSCTLSCADKHGTHAVTCKVVGDAGTPLVSCGCHAPIGPSIIEYTTETATCGSACGKLMSTKEAYYLGQMSTCAPEAPAPP